MKQKCSIESVLHCKATAELEQSVNEDLQKSDGSLKELIDESTTDQSPNDKEPDCSRSTKE